MGAPVAELEIKCNASEYLHIRVITLYIAHDIDGYSVEIVISERLISLRMMV